MSGIAINLALFILLSLFFCKSFPYPLLRDTLFTDPALFHQDLLGCRPAAFWTIFMILADRERRRIDLSVRSVSRHRPVTGRTVHCILSRIPLARTSAA